jgi:hypothetical protein
VHDRLSGLGLHNVSLRSEDELLDGCPCADEPCRHLQTYEGKIPYQDDYLYMSRIWCVEHGLSGLTGPRRYKRSATTSR